MRKLLLSAAVLLATTALAPAAVIGDLGLNPTSANGAFDNGSLAPGAFNDQWTFQLNNFSTYFTVASATNVFPGASDFITNFSGSVFEIVGAVGGGDDLLVLGPANGLPICGPSCQAFGGSAFLPSGDYYLNISGIAGTTSGYGGNLATVGVGAVPEPATWAMMILGFLGIAGMGGARNKWKGFRLA